MTNGKVKIWLRFRFCWARRRAGPDLPAPPLPSEGDQTGRDDQGTQNGDATGYKESENETNDRVKYPYFILHHTAEEAAAETKLRADSAPPFPESELRRAWAKMEANSTS